MTKYQEIISSLKKKITQGELEKGSKLPSIRRLSLDFKCSKDTVQRALSELRYQKLIYVVPKSGYYVLGASGQQEQLAIKVAKNQTTAYEDFKTCLMESLVGRETFLFNTYKQDNGLEDLIQSLQSILANDAVYAKKEQIIVTSGTQQALYILSQMAFPNQKRTILLEQPTYHQMNTIVSSQNLPYETIERGLDGLDFEELERIFAQGEIKFFYTIPRFSNPLHLNYSKEEKQTLVQLANQYDVYLVEDDYMADFDENHQMPLHYWDVNERVIYLKSFSSSLFPALRLGAIVLPSHLTKIFLDYKRLIDYDTNLIMQKALSLYIDNGMFSRTKANLSSHYQEINTVRTTKMVSKGRLRTCPIKLDFMETSYIGTCPNVLVRFAKEEVSVFDEWLSQQGKRD